MLDASELNCRRLTSLDHLKATSKTYSFSVFFLVILMYITFLSLSSLSLCLSLSLICCAVFTARCYAERGYATVSRLSVCLSVRLSVTLRYDFHIGWNTSKIISRPNSSKPMRLVTPTWAIWCNENTPKFGGDQRWGGKKWRAGAQKRQYLRNA